MVKFKKVQLLVPDKKRLAYIGSIHNNLGDLILYEAYRLLLKDYNLFDKRANKYFDFFESMVPLPFFRAALLGGGTLIYKSPEKLRLLQFYCYGKGLKLFCMGTGLANPDYWNRQKNRPWDDVSAGWNTLLRRFSLIGVRGPVSKKILERNGIDNVEVTGDTALALAKDTYAKKSFKKTIGFNFGKSNGFVWGGEERSLVNIEKLLRQLIKDGYHIILMPVWENDYSINEDIYTRINIPSIEIQYYATDFQNYCATLDKCDLFIGEKLHSVIIAHLTRTPAIMLEYRPKCFDYMSSMEYEELNIRLDEFDLNNILGLVKDIESDIHGMQEQIDARVISYKKKLNKFAMKVAAEIER